jgi:hypothetical protein
MSTKKALALAGWFLVLGSGLVMAQEKNQDGAANMVQNKVRVQTKAQPQVQERARFRDQNADGINDFQRDHDNDGIPNCQDPDWKQPGDGTGYKSRFAQNGSPSQTTNRKGFQGGQDWSNSSFRSGLKGLGAGICDGSGPKGSGQRRGRS